MAATSSTPPVCAGCDDVIERAVAQCRDGWVVGLVCDCPELTPISRIFPTQADALTALRILSARDQVPA